MEAAQPHTATVHPGDVELHVDGHVVLLRGNVIEMFGPAATHHALHVCHVAIEARPTRGGDMVVRIGIDVRGTVVDGVRLRIDAAGMVAMTRLIDEAKRRRSAITLAQEAGRSA